MSATFALAGVGNLIGGALVHSVGPRWIWGVAGGGLFVAALAGSLLAVHHGEESVSDAEVAAVEEITEEELGAWPGEDELRRLERSRRPVTR
jgi:hypothetical protein